MLPLTHLTICSFSFDLLNFNSSNFPYGGGCQCLGPTSAYNQENIVQQEIVSEVLYFLLLQHRQISFSGNDARTIMNCQSDLQL